MPVIPSKTGRIIANHGDALAVEDSNRSIFRCIGRRKLNPLVCGDIVEWIPQTDGTGFIETLQPRRSVLTRRIRDTVTKLIASNFDQVLITLAPKPEPDSRLIDAYLIACEQQQINAVLLINKIDLHDSTHSQTLQVLENIYVNLDYPVLKISAKHNMGIESLKNRLQRHTSILVGQSGVGKSSLIKQLLPDASIQIGHVSEITGLGNHTTTTTMLYHLPEGGELIDSPGVREFIPEQFTKAIILNGFREFRQYMDQCRFNDCSHINEPKCAVIEAVKSGKIHPHRWENYKTLTLEATRAEY